MSSEQSLSRLTEFLLVCFDAGEIRRFLAYLPDGTKLSQGLPGATASAAQVASEAVRALDQLDYLTGDEFWARFKELRPRRADQIDAHRALFRGPAASPAASATQASRDAEDRLRILMVSASPIGQAHLSVDVEFARIIDTLRNRRNLRIEQRTAVTFTRLRQAVTDFKPHVLHICAHGTPGTLYFQPDESGAAQKVPTSALARLLRAAGKDLRLVVLNACDSLEMAQALVADDQPIVGWAIGMIAPIFDTDAIAFSSALYDSIAAGMPLGDAHEAALSELELIPDGLAATRPADIPRLVPEDPARARGVVLGPTARASSSLV